MAINPFRYGSVVEARHFCNRKRELADLKSAVDSSQRLFIYSERRMGKTSLVQQFLGRLPRSRYTSVLIDLWPTEGIKSFTETTGRGLTLAAGPTPDKILGTARRLFSRIAPAVSLDTNGNVQVTLRLASDSALEPALDEVLSLPQKLAEERGSRVVVVFDEFQRITEYPDDRVERVLRTKIQRQPDVAYIFLGSRKRIIQSMVVDQARPLYRAGMHYPLGPIETRDWLPFIRGNFNDSGKRVPDDLIRSVCETTGGHPFYTQHLCHALWELCPAAEPSTVQLLEEAIQLLLDREKQAYIALWESFTLNQRRLLKGLASEPEAPKVYSGAFLKQYGIASPASVQGVVSALLDRDVIEGANGSFVVSDRFFRIWIARTCVEGG